jgi:tetratricopeptide (TPR) repeat protein
MRQRLPIKRSNPPSPATSASLISTIRSYLPGVWIAPKNNELVTLYRLRYKMALEEQKYDTALIFLNKILEIDPMNAEAKLSKGEIYHRCLQDYPRAIEQYNKVLRTTTESEAPQIHVRARAAMAEIMEMLS